MAWRKWIVAPVALAVVGIGITGGTASAAPGSRPAITFVSPSPDEGATLTTSSVSFAFTYNRTPKQTQSLVCSLSGPTSSSGPCNAPVASGSGSQSGKSYSGLANGSYTFSVLLTLTDRGTTSATRQFTIDLGPHLYWGSVSTGAIGRANADGTGLNPNFISGATFPTGVAVDANHVYWANTDFPNGRIGRANLDGTGPDQNFISGANFPEGVAVDANHVYWTNAFGNTIGRANLDGTGADQSFISGASFPIGVTVDANYIYWSNIGNGTIGRANLDGTGVNPNFITGATWPEGMAVNANHIYWADVITNTIGRANLDGTAANQNFISGGSFPTGLAIDTNYVYWTNGSLATIGRANLDGTGVNQSFINGLPTGPNGGPQGLAIDAG
jgi:sugar lactone lactonase YvrE